MQICQKRIVECQKVFDIISTRYLVIYFVAQKELELEFEPKGRSRGREILGRLRIPAHNGTLTSTFSPLFDHSPKVHPY